MMARKPMTTEEVHTIVSSIVAPGGSFCAATCPRCLVVKRPYHDVKVDDGQPCWRCRDEEKR